MGGWRRHGSVVLASSAAPLHASSIVVTVVHCEGGVWPIVTLHGEMHIVSRVTHIRRHSLVNTTRVNGGRVLRVVIVLPLLSGV